MKHGLLIEGDRLDGQVDPWRQNLVPAVDQDDEIAGTEFEVEGFAIVGHKEAAWVVNGMMTEVERTGATQWVDEAGGWGEYLRTVASWVAGGVVVRLWITSGISATEFDSSAGVGHL